MFTRVSTNSINESILNYLNKNLSKLNDTVSEISTGKKINNVSDDVIDGMTIISSNNSLSAIDTYTKNINSANTEIDTTDSTLSEISNAIQSVTGLVTQASNSTYTADDLKAINNTIQSYKETILGLANTEYAGKYLFSGTNITNVAYTEDKTTGAIIYNGTASSGDYERKTEISDGVTVITNACGEDVFGYSTHTNSSGTTIPGKGLFDTLDKISKLLTANPPDHVAISSTIDNLNNALDTVTNTRSKLAGISTRLTMASDQLTTAKTNYTSRLSDAQDIDYASSISDLTATQTAYQASLSASSKIMKLSLLNYM
ncbi:MAG: flagellar hook-associated protein FlgL [Candidatus Gastranaerophilaceae bacterium]|jgi:flagellar hook-associated protein 3 FlgL